MFWTSDFFPGSSKLQQIGREKFVEPGSDFVPPWFEFIQLSWTK